MSFTTTRAPSAAKASACARPSPPPAPVTMTTRSSQIPKSNSLPQVSLAAVDHQRCPRDVAGVVTQQERDRTTHVLLEIADPAERNAGDEVVELLPCELRPHLQPRRHAVRDHGIDAHAGSAPLDGGRTAQRANHLLRPRVERETGRIRS